MSTAMEEILKAERGEGCLGKTASDEPVFVLRARDMLAPSMVMKWARAAEEWGAPKKKVEGARNVAWAMLDWQGKNGKKVPD